MARKNSDKLEDSIIQLSQLLRYSLYSGMEKVPIEKEVEYIDNYIRLQSLRFGSHAHVGFRKNIEGRGLLEPMLLVPFVENAFKHGIVQVDDPVIDIRIDVKEKQLQFDVKNRFVPGSGEQKDETSGIGLANVRRRLHLLYKDAHELAIEEKEGWFIVSLKILLE
jgi:sensor histidine kinase YesM